MRRLSTTEIFLLEFIGYSALWMWNDYVALILSLSFSLICLFILAISLVAETLERSKAPRWYYVAMIVSIVAPLIVMAFFTVLKKGYMDWRHPFG